MIYTTLLNIAIFQGIVLGVIILKSPLFKDSANKFLAFAIFTLSVLLLNLVFEITEAYNTIPFLRFIDSIEWAFIFPVFIFLFVINKTNHPKKNSKKILWLFLPFWYSASFSLVDYLNIDIGLSNAQNLESTIVELLNQIELFLAVTFIPTILIYTYRLVKFSKNEQEKQWLIILWTIVSTFMFSWVIAILIALFSGYEISYIMKIIALFTTFLIHWTAYFGIYKFKLAKNKPAIYTLLNNGLLTPYKSISTENNTVKEDKKEVLTLDNHHFKKLETLCKNNKIYTDSTLNRERIAEELGISAGYVSQLVNTITGENFTNYINKYRVNAVKKMILDSEFKNYSLLAIGLESGFTSKTTFYKSFKKVTGMTPNEYRNSQK